MSWLTRKEMMTFHRFQSWWLGFFAIISILTGYVVAREWLQNIAFWERAHLIIQWTFIVIFVFHMIYTLGWVKIKTLKLLKYPGKNWVRLLQQATKWLIIVFTALVVFTGLSYYPWMTAIWFKSLFPFGNHISWDFYLSLSIIIHLLCGIKVLFIRHRASTLISDVGTLLLGALLISGLFYLEFLV